MARMAIDDSVARDPRITALSGALGWSRRETVGCLILDVWAICYDQETHLVSERMIDLAAGRDGFAKLMIECQLASTHRSGKVQIRGARERIEYLAKKKASGREGGLKSGEVRRKNGKHSFNQRSSKSQASWNPPDPDPDLDLVPDRDLDRDRDLSPDPRAREESESPPPVDSPGLAEVKRKVDAAEAETVRYVLDKLTKRNGVSYTANPEHTKLIISRLHDGYTRDDLCKIIAYCAVEIGWAESDKFRPNLNPHTLFGDGKITKYIDAARSWFESHEQRRASP